MFDKKEEKSMMSDIEAIDLIKSWGDILDVDTESEGFLDVIEEIKMSVRKEKLAFDEDSMSFKYVLLSPIIKQDGGKISTVTISEMDMEAKREAQKFKDNQSVDKAIAMLAASLGIENGFAGRIKDRDAGRINAVILGFFVQVRRT